MTGTFAAVAAASASGVAASPPTSSDAAAAVVSSSARAVSRVGFALKASTTGVICEIFEECCFRGFVYCRQRIADGCALRTRLLVCMNEGKSLLDAVRQLHGRQIIPYRVQCSSFCSATGNHSLRNAINITSGFCASFPNLIEETPEAPVVPVRVRQAVSQRLRGLFRQFGIVNWGGRRRCTQCRSGPRIYSARLFGKAV